MVVEPSTVKATLVVLAIVWAPLLGAVIATTGGLPRVMVAVAVLLSP
jgi:hypothetical protein